MSFDFAHLYCTFRLSIALQTALAAPSLVFCPYARTCSLHHRRGYDCRCYARGAPSRSPAEGSPEHAHTGKILRDHRGPWCNMRVNPYGDASGLGVRTLSN